MSAVEELPRGVGTLRRALLLELAEFDPWTADADGLERASRVLGEVNRRLRQAIHARINEIEPPRIEAEEAEEAARVLWPDHLPRLDGVLLDEARQRHGGRVSHPELEVLAAYAAGLGPKETAERLGVSRSLVCTRRKSARLKLVGEPSTLAEAVQEAVRLGLLTPVTHRVVIGRH